MLALGHVHHTPLLQAAPQGPKKGAATAAETECSQPGDLVSLSNCSAPAPEKTRPGVLARLGKTAATLALAGMILGTAGCAVTTAACGPYGCSQETVLVAPNGGVYYQQTPQPYYGGYHHHHGYQGPYVPYNEYPNTRCITNSWGGVACY